MRVFSTGQVTRILGIHRDKLFSLTRAGAPDASLRCGNRKAYTEDDVMKLWRFLVDEKFDVRKPEFDAEETPVQTEIVRG